MDLISIIDEISEKSVPHFAFFAPPWLLLARCRYLRLRLGNELGSLLDVGRGAALHSAA